MKKVVGLIAIAIAFISCENQEFDFDDFEYTGAYFPYQYPVRTLVLGDYIYDNTNDNNHKFIISVAMGGVYENTKDREFEIEVDNSLCDQVLFSAEGDTIRALPEEYYDLSSSTTLVIPAGEFHGGVEVQLQDAFFNDPQAIELSYVVPLRIIGSADVDTILSGSSSFPDADPRVEDEWDISPMDFTMFAVKYINEYHGTYLHYGSSVVTDGAGNTIEQILYSEANLVDNSTLDLATTARNQVSLYTFLQSEIMTGEIGMLLDFDGDNCTITAAAADSVYTISGTGIFKSKAYEWGNKERDGIELNYTVTDGAQTYEANDVLVIRDRGVGFETYSPVTY